MAQDKPPFTISLYPRAAFDLSWTWANDEQTLRYVWFVCQPHVRWKGRFYCIWRFMRGGRIGIQLTNAQWNTWIHEEGT